LHVSCSDKFPGGFGKKGGPPKDKPDYQIVAYFITIVKKKGGKSKKSSKSSKSEKPDKTCGSLLGDAEVPNAAKATFTFASEAEEREDDDIVIITGPVTLSVLPKEARAEAKTAARVAASTSVKTTVTRRRRRRRRSKTTEMMVTRRKTRGGWSGPVDGGKRFDL